MKMLTATVILAAATLAGPAAVGQSEGFATAHLVSASASDYVQVASRPIMASSRSIREFERSGSTEDPSTAPRPVASWIMALAFLGFVALRRTRSPLD